MAQDELFIGVDLGGTYVRAGLVCRDRLLETGARAIHEKGSSEEVFEDLCAVIDEVMKKDVRGIGVGVPGLVDSAQGIIFDVTNIPSWKKVSLGSRLEKKYDLPVKINNDANCFALGEKHFGWGKDSDNFVGLIIGTGLGAGIISNGRLHAGTFCGAGEFGLIPYGDSILEHYASGQFFRKFGRNGAELALAAGKGDAEAREIFSEYGRNLGYAVKLILYALAPGLIILGGSVSNSWKYFRRSLEESLGDFAYHSIARALKFRVSRTKNIAVLGAASLFLDK